MAKHRERQQQHAEDDGADALVIGETTEPTPDATPEAPPPVAPETNGQAATSAPVGKAKDTPRGRFVRLAEKRVFAALKRLEAVGNMGNAASYESTDDERERIIGVLNNAAQDMAKKLRRQKTAAAAFKLF